MTADDDDARPMKEQNINKLRGRADDELAGAEDPAKRTLRIRALNDELRTRGHGGKVMIGGGLAALGPALVRIALEAVKTFDAFGPDNDPWGEHDCAGLEAFGLSIMWKIDYYERSGRIASPDPADPAVTFRVLTVMLADEY